MNKKSGGTGLPGARGGSGGDVVVEQLGVTRVHLVEGERERWIVTTPNGMQVDLIVDGRGFAKLEISANGQRLHDWSGSLGLGGSSGGAHGR